MKRSSNLMKTDSFKEKQVSSFALNEVYTKETSDHEEHEHDSTGSEKEQIGGKLSKIEQEAYEQGFAAGEEAGRALGLRKLDPTEKLLLKMIQEMNGLKMLILKETEEDILTIALAVARRILGQEIRLDPEILLNTIQKAIKKIGQTEKISIRLHPDDFALLSQDADQVIHPLHNDILLKFEADIGLSLGDCIVEGEDRIVDARRQQQFNLLEETLRGTEER